MRGIASAQISRGSQTCIVVGGLDGVAELDLGVYPNVLWFGRGAGTVPDRLRAHPANVSVEPLERLDAKRTVSALDRFIRLDAIRLPSIFVTEDAVGESAVNFLPIIEAIFAQCEMHHRVRGFRQQQGFISQKHVLANLPAYVRRRVPRTWAGALEGVPAFVCGAGPSLDASAAKLAECARHGAVLAADSALRALDKRGIEVDFAVAVDARKTPENCLPPGTRIPARVILASAGAPAWLQAVPRERLYFLSGRQRTEDLLAQAGIAKTAAAISENCGTTAIELALYLGCQPICLFGMDHAVDSKDPSRWHSQDLTESLQKQMQLPPDRNYPKIPGNYQDEIATPLFREWRFLDNRCAALPAGLVRNVIDRGARLRNTTLVHPDDFAADPVWPEKSPHFAGLSAADSVGDDEWEKLRTAVVRDAGCAEEVVAEALRELQHGRLPLAIQVLAALFKDDRFGILFGNYSLKMRPHLENAAGSSPRLWPELARECHELCALAKSTR